MNIYRNFDDIPFDKNTVLTVGTFDGVHLGHQVIINKLKAISSEYNLRNVLITIDPHPQIVLHKPGSPKVELLTDIEERLLLFEKFGIQNTLIIPFTYEFSRTEPETFVRDYLLKRVGASNILIGYDHMFGKNREGDLALLKRLGNELEFSVEKIDALQSGEVIVSSTKIRKALSNNEIEYAAEMLGHNYMVIGHVIEGDKRGRTIGYPTANIKPVSPNKLIPGNGVYIVSADIGAKNYFGMANIGVRPTFKVDDKPLLEVYFFDYEGEIYGKKLNICFHRYLRKEHKFSSVEELIKQLNRDKVNSLELIEDFYKV